MASISKIAKELAAKIAYQLNQKDSNPTDNYIDANIWKQYAVGKYGAKDDANMKKISIFNAEKSIEGYLNIQSRATGKSVSEIGEKWYSDLAGINGGQQILSNKGIASNIEKNDATAVARVNIPEEKTILAGKKPTVKQMLHINTRTLKDCKAITKKHIQKELKRRGLTKMDAEIEYWTERIGYMAYKYNIPDEILVSIIGRECKFSKNTGGDSGNGAMALTTIAIEDMFPDKNWSDVYEMIDANLYSDIFYEKDENENVMRDSNGQPVLKYSKASDVRKACRKDDFSMKVGTLCFEMNYVKALTMVRLGKTSILQVSQAQVKDTIVKLKAGEIDFSKINNEEVVALAMQIYNNHPKHKRNYSIDTMKSLRAQGFDFQKQNIVKQI